MKKTQDISSAEMTAYWRTQYPNISQDSLSNKLATSAGIAKAHEFEKQYNYPLVGRKVSVRAGFFLEQAVSLISTGQYDACISFASGFSLLSYYIRQTIHNTQSHVSIIDTDLPDIIAIRQERLKNIKGTIDKVVQEKIKSFAFDLEEASEKKLKLTDIFQYKSPLFIIEGVLYFLSESCVQWLFTEIAAYTNAAVIFDYWPKNSVESSACFRRAFAEGNLNSFMPEKVKSFWDKNSLTLFNAVRNYPVEEIEQQYSKKLQEPPQLCDKNQFFPMQFLVAEKLPL